MDQDSSPHPDLDIARYGTKRDGDRFVGFWLALAMEAKQNRSLSNARQARRIVDRFYAGKELQKAFGAVGRRAVNAELRRAAALYYTSCLTDPQYSSTMWRVNRIEPEKLRAKMAADTATTLAMLAESGVLQGEAAQLPVLLTDGFLDALAPEGAQELTTAVNRSSSALRAMESSKE